jgi:hypothetical protein
MVSLDLPDYCYGRHPIDERVVNDVVSGVPTPEADVEQHALTDFDPELGSDERNPFENELDRFQVSLARDLRSLLNAAEHGTYLTLERHTSDAFYFLVSEVELFENEFESIDATNPAYHDAVRQAHLKQSMQELGIHLIERIGFVVGKPPLWHECERALSRDLYSLDDST